ncbi:hypothetical protein BHF71_07755 [Vulcanibacillus modesticaldus]|uniref:Cytosolic protein n=1 Tax=Vulcanibacillus modesticaldus TaxID=337097 RepID=A0A1D2YVM5_9BACI|nr:DUF6125 family protein [Vulcanibacillus modesticaldus]OEF99713.1 hypothetical protein BHF71_07755 [Vulcanibacillus modesticaldus]
MEISDLSREELLKLVEDFGKRWLAHDGLWFQAIERSHGMDEAIEKDIEAWERFTEIEAKRIKKFLRLPESGGLEALEKALNFRLYAVINKQEMIREDKNTLVFRMNECRVQEARKRKKMPLFPCKPVGIVEYSGFAKTIDSRIQTEVISCPPDETDENYYCAWKFTLDEQNEK